jgi:hypothetical protein
MLNTERFSEATAITPIRLFWSQPQIIRGFSLVATEVRKLAERSRTGNRGRREATPTAALNEADFVAFQG